MDEKQQAFQFHKDLEAVRNRQITADDFRSKYSKEQTMYLKSVWDKLKVEIEDEDPGFFARMAAGFATTPEGEANIYKNFGVDAEVNPATGEVERRTGFEGYSRPVDPEGFDSGDIADMVGRAPRTLGSIAMSIPGLATTPFTGPVGLAAGATAGGVLGAGVEQGIGNLLGSQEGVNTEDLLTEAAIGAVSGGATELGIKGLKGLNTLLRGKGMTPDLKKNITDKARKLKDDTGVEMPIPLSSLTESPTAASFERRGAEGILTSDKFKRNYGDPIEQASEEAIEKIGAPFQGAVGADDASEQIFRSAELAKEARSKTIEDAYGKYRSLIPFDTPITTNQTQLAIDEMRDRTGSTAFGKARNINLDSIRVGPKNIEIGKRIQKITDNFSNDIKQLETFGELDAWRKRVGQLTADATYENMGLTPFIKRIYGAINEDLDILFKEGSLPSSVSESAKKATKLAEEDKLLDQTAASRWLRDEEKGEGLVRKILGNNTTAKQLQGLKQVIGAQGTPQGQVAQQYGLNAIQALQSEALEEIRDASFEAGTKSGTPIISGFKLRKKLDSIGVNKLNELFSEQFTEQIYNFTDLLSNIQKRGQVAANFSGTAQANEALGFWNEIFSNPPRAILGKLANFLTFGGAVTPGSRTQRFFTEPSFQDATGIGQQSLRALGRASQQLASRKAEEQRR